MTIYDRIDKVLKEKGMSRRNLARLAGIPETTIASAFARRPERFPVQHLLKIATVLDTPWQKLIAGTEEERYLAREVMLVTGEPNIKKTVNGKTSMNGVDVTMQQQEGEADERKSRLLSSFDSLNTGGQDEVIRFSELMEHVPEYKK